MTRFPPNPGYVVIIVIIFIIYCCYISLFVVVIVIIIESDWGPKRRAGKLEKEINKNINNNNY